MNTDLAIKTILFAAAASLSLIAGAYAGSEGYQSGPSRPIVGSTALVATGSEAYQMPSAAGTSQTSSFVLRDVGSEATPIFFGEATASSVTANR
jgi:hypothetical protein